MKKFITLFLISALMFTLASCKSESEIYQEKSMEALDVLTLYLEDNNVLPLDISNYQFNSEGEYIVEGDSKFVQITVYYDNGDRFENIGIYNYDVNTNELYYFDVVANDYVKVSEKN